MLAAESFQKTYEKGGEPKVRRRSRDEVGRFSDEPQPSNPSSHHSQLLQSPFMCGPIPAFSNLSVSGSSAQTLTKQVSMTSRACVQKYGPVASKAAVKARAGMAEFAVVAAEVYRQECKTDNRGADDEFFVEVKEDCDNNSLLMDSHSIQSSEQRDNRNEVSPKNGMPRSKNSPDLKRPPVVATSTSDSSYHHITPPPQVRRQTSPDGTMEVPKEVSTGGGGDLRNARMDLFRNQSSGMDDPSKRLEKALEDLNRQDDFIQSLKRQMEMTQSALDDATQELLEARAIAKEKQFKATEIRARAVQEKKRLEDQHEKEVQKNKQLQESISQLQVEVSTLKNSLRNSRSARSPTNGKNNENAGNNALVMSLKAEIVELRSRLAEAHANAIDDSSTRHSTGELDDLKGRLRRYEAELKDLRQKKEETSRLEENLKIAVQSADDVRAELNRTKAQLQRLERERSRQRLNSAADVDRISKDLAKANEECEELKKELSRVQNSAKEEQNNLKKELLQLRTASQETLTNNAETMREQRRLQDEVARHVSEIKELQEMMSRKDEELEELRGERNNFERDSEKLSHLSRELDFSRAKETAMSQELKLHKTLLEEARKDPTDPVNQEFLNNLNEQAIDELRRHLENVRATEAAIDSHTLDKALKERVSEMRRSLAESQLNKRRSNSESQTSEARLAAMEHCFLNEITVLKAKLAESQAKVEEQSYWAQEARRVNRDGEAESMAQVQQLQRDKKNLELQVEELRKKLSSTPSTENAPSLSPALTAAASLALASENTNNDIMGVPNNVKRLRGELAAARERLAAARERSHFASSGSNGIDTQNRTRQTDPGMDRPDGNAKPMAPSSAGMAWSPQSISTNVPDSAPSPKGPELYSTSRSTELQTPRVSNLSLEELTRQLEASRKRLQTADERLNGLVHNEGSLLTIVRRNLDDSTVDGSIDEVVDTADGSIEVNHRRFADI